MYCPYCGSEIPDHLTICNVCGNKLDPNIVKGKSGNTSDKPPKGRSPQKHETRLRSVILAAGIAIGLIAGIGISLLGNTKPDPAPDVPAPEIPAQSNTSEQASAANSGSEQNIEQNTEQSSAQNTASGTAAQVPDSGTTASGSKEEASDSKTYPSDSASSGIHSEESSAQNSTSDSASSKTPAKNAAASEKLLREQLVKTIGSDSNIADFCVSDYDRDGTFEAFALVGKPDDYDVFFGSLYFVTEDSAETVISESPFYAYSEQNHMLRFDECDFYLVGEYYTTADLSYVFGVRNGNYYEHDFSRKGTSLRQEEPGGDMTIILSEYDATYDKSTDMYMGHTWKPYYLYWDGDFREYGGIEISVDDLLKCSGAQKYVDMITNHGFRIDSIYYRANGIININYSSGDSSLTQYDNMTLIRNGSSVTVKQISSQGGDDPAAYSYGGIYKPALYSDIASYPGSF